MSRKLGVTAATMSHHLSRLKMTGGLLEERWGKAVYYRLDRDQFLNRGQSSLLWLTTGEAVATDPFFKEDGSLNRWPAKRAERYAVMAEICKRLETDAAYSSDAMYRFAKEIFEEDPWEIIGAGMEHWMFARIGGGYIVQSERYWRK